MRDVRIRRGAGFGGTFRPPGDKSISHRAALFAGLAAGTSRLEGLNGGEDVRRSLTAMAALGAGVRHEAGAVWVRGTAGVLTQPEPSTLDCGNSGTTLRLLAGILAAHPLRVVLTGDDSLCRRPVARVAEPLRRMGAEVEATPAGTPPLAVAGGTLRPVELDLAVASAQVATAILLAGLGATGRTRVGLPGPARDHTERMLGAFGVPVHSEPRADGGRWVSVTGPARLTAADVTVAGDPSSAAFLFAAAATIPGSRVRAECVSVNPTRTGFLDVLAAMGAGITRHGERETCGEPVADVEVTGPERLAAFDVPAAWVPRLIDEAPAWAVVASAADGVSRLSGAGELRVKESDRIGLLCENLRRLGIGCEEHASGMAIRGGPVSGGAGVRTALDHRMVMAFAALGARTAAPVTVDDAAPADTSYPGYFDTLRALGAVVEGAS